MKTKQIGAATIDTVLEHAGPTRTPFDMYPKVTQDIVDRNKVWLRPGCMETNSEMLIFAYQSFLLRLPGLTALIDTCVGEDKERPFRPLWHHAKWPWLDNLRAVGVEPEEIDLVMCTHLHADHIGWNTRLSDGQWVPTFPNARYLFAKTEYEYWETQYENEEWMTNAFKDSVLPIMDEGKADLVDEDYEIQDGLWLEGAPGHTPGGVCIHLENPGGKAVFSGDLVHHPLQIPEAQLSTIFCTDMELSAATRQAFVERHADTNTLILPAHFADETAGRIVSTAEGCRFSFDRP